MEKSIEGKRHIMDKNYLLNDLSKYISAAKNAKGNGKDRPIYMIARRQSLSVCASISSPICCLFNQMGGVFCVGEILQGGMPISHAHRCITLLSSNIFGAGWCRLAAFGHVNMVILSMNNDLCTIGIHSKSLGSGL